MTARWLIDAAEQVGADIEWRNLSLAVVNADRRVDVEVLGVPVMAGGALQAANMGDEFLFEASHVKTKIRCQIERFELSGHADREELVDFAVQCSPRSIVITHGDPPDRVAPKVRDSSVASVLLVDIVLEFCRLRGQAVLASLGGGALLTEPVAQTVGRHRHVTLTLDMAMATTTAYWVANETGIQPNMPNTPPRHTDGTGAGHHGHGGAHDHHPHSSSGNLRVAFLLNLAFTVIEVIGGLWTNSIAILSDAVHDLGDTMSLGSAWYFDRSYAERKLPRWTELSLPTVPRGSPSGASRSPATRTQCGSSRSSGACPKRRWRSPMVATTRSSRSTCSRPAPARRAT